MSRLPRGDLTFYEEVGRRIKKARQGQFSQEFLANLLAVSRTTIVNIEQGRQQMYVHMLLDIARLLRVEITTLFPPRRGWRLESIRGPNRARRIRPRRTRS